MWRANPGPQRAFMKCPIREILYGGAKGGGKTDAIGPKALKHVKKYGRWATVLILRETYGQLTEIMERMSPLCRRAKAVYNKTEKTWRFPSGARIIFGHLGKGCDPYWGQEYSLIIIDEVTRTIKTEADYLKLLGSLRNSHGIPCSVVLTSNPGGVGHNWVKARFMGVPPMTVQKDHETGLERVFIPAKLKDNPKLPAEYRATLEQLPDAERAAFLDGDWDAFEGAVFKLLPGIHVWTWAQFNKYYGLPEGNRKPPSSWSRYRSYDHGFAAPGAAYWYAEDHIGRAIVYRELYTIAKDAKGEIVPNKGSSTPPRDVARMVATRSEGETYAGSWSGRDLFDEVRGDHSGGVTLASHFSAEDVFFTAWTTGPNSRLAGKQALHQRMAVTYHPDGTVKDYPLIIFILEETPQAQRTLPTLVYAKHDPEQVDDTGEDHCFDSIAGFCKMRPVVVAEPDEPKQDGWRDQLDGDEDDWMVAG